VSDPDRIALYVLAGVALGISVMFSTAWAARHPRRELEQLLGQQRAREVMAAARRRTVTALWVVIAAIVLAFSLLTVR